MGNSIFDNPAYESPLGNWLENSSTNANMIHKDTRLSIKLERIEKISTGYNFILSIYQKDLSGATATITIYEHNHVEEHKIIVTSNIVLMDASNITCTIEVPHSRINNISRSKEYGSFEFIATIKSGLSSASSSEFELPFKNLDGMKIKEKEENKCFCNKDLTAIEFKNIIVELRKNTTDQKGKAVYPVHQDKIFYLNVGKLPKDEQNNYTEFARVLNSAFNEFNINTCLRKIHFLAQSYPETKYFSVLKEIGESLKYDPFRGRGLIQLTAEKDVNGNWIGGSTDSRTGNSTSYLGYKKYSEKDVISNPDIISNSLYESARSAGWFWRFGKRLKDGSILDLNTLADKDDVDDVSHKVNGGTEARRQRKEAYEALKKIFKYENCINKK